MLLVSLLACAAVTMTAAAAAPVDNAERFRWGTATASYQVEGAWQADGRTPSVWDVFSHTPGKVYMNQTGDVADDHYHRYREDIALMAKLGVDTARLSLSWSRIVPDARPHAPETNARAIAHYRDVLTELRRHNIEPLITLYHWDLPYTLSTMQPGAVNGSDPSAVRGWLDERIVAKFAAYADVCFAAFGDLASWWTTFNEPQTFCVGGYNDGHKAPGRCSDRGRCAAGNSSTEPYVCTHNVLRAHAAAVALFRTRHRGIKNGRIGINLSGTLGVPLRDDVPADVAAAERNNAWTFAWHADPVYFGRYPDVMRARLGARLPSFSAAESASLRGSVDFFAINHYTTHYVTDNPRAPLGRDYISDQGISGVHERDGVPIGERADSDWLWVVPWGMRTMLNWIAQRYRSPPIYVTENGVDVPGEDAMPIADALQDRFRQHYYLNYTAAIRQAIVDDGVDVRGYMAWSLLDNFEWQDGYSKRFGLHYVDFKSANLTRYVKQSARVYAGIVAKGMPLKGRS